MSWLEHYKRAERFVELAGDPEQSLEHQAQYARLAQVHATLAAIGYIPIGVPPITYDMKTTNTP